MTTCSADLTDRLATAEETGLDATHLVPLLRLLATGDPVAVTTLAAAAGRTIEETRAALAKVPDTRRPGHRPCDPHGTGPSQASRTMHS